MELEVGAILDGKVTGITKFGAFVALPGGKSGLVHISEVAYSYVSDVNEFLTVGQDVKVKVIGIDDNNRINLSIKQTLPAPARPARPGARPAGRPAPNGGAGRPYHSNNNSGAPRPPRPAGPARSTPKEPLTFEDKLKQYMSESESRLSELNRFSDRGRRRGGRRGGN